MRIPYANNVLQDPFPQKILYPVHSVPQALFLLQTVANAIIVASTSFQARALRLARLVQMEKLPCEVLPTAFPAAIGIYVNPALQVDIIFELNYFVWTARQDITQATFGPAAHLV